MYFFSVSDWVFTAGDLMPCKRPNFTKVYGTTSHHKSFPCDGLPLCLLEAIKGRPAPPKACSRHECLNPWPSCTPTNSSKTGFCHDHGSSHQVAHVAQHRRRRRLLPGDTRSISPVPPPPRSFPRPQARRRHEMVRGLLRRLAQRAVHLQDRRAAQAVRYAHHLHLTHCSNM